MGIIMINCPATGRGVSTGIETIGFEDLPVVTAKMLCSACGRVHDWTKADAWLDDTGEQYRLGPLSPRAEHRGRARPRPELRVEWQKGAASPRPLFKRVCGS